MSAIKKILLPTDFSEASEKAVRYAMELGKPTNAEFRFIHIVETYPIVAYSGGSVWSDPKFEKQLLESAQTQMKEFLQKVNAPKNVSEKVEIFFGATASRITAEAKEFGADMIVMSTHGRSGLEHFFVGSVTERVLKMAPCPVLVIPKGH